MIPLAHFPARRAPRVYLGAIEAGVQRADAAVAAAGGRAQRPARTRSAIISTIRCCCSCRCGCCSASSPRSATALLARGIGIDGAHTRHVRRAVASPPSSSSVELLLPLADRRPRSRARARISCCRRSRRSRARSGRSRGWIAAHAIASAKRAGGAATPDEAAEEAERSRQGLHRHGRAGRDHRGRGAAAAAEHRRFRRHARARGDDAAARHRRHPRGRDDRRPARAVPRAGVLALPGLQGEPRQHRRLRLREGSGRCSAPPTMRGRSRRCCGRRSSCPRPSGCPSC